MRQRGGGCATKIQKVDLKNEVLQTNELLMNLSWNNKQHPKAALSLTDYTKQPLGSSIIHLYVAFGNALAARSCVHFHVHDHIATRCKCFLSVGRGVVRQLTSCANDHLAAASHNVLQRHPALYCLCCHGDIRFSSIKC